MNDSYLSIEAPAEGLYKEKGSKFIAWALPVRNEEEVKQALEKIKGQHPSARHACYAYLLGIDRELYRANDDGEPSGTAGLPILGQIRSKEVSDVLVVVIRYFGGTKLGVSGLKNAYKTAAREALDAAILTEKVLQSAYELSFGYPSMSEVMAALHALNATITAQDFTQNCKLTFSVRKRESEAVEQMFGKMGNLELRSLNP